MKDPPRRLLTLLSSGLGVLFFVSLVYSERLPDEILGVNKLFWHIFLFVVAIAANVGARLLDWIRHISMRGKK